MTGIIYSATNKTNCMTYVGQTIRSLKARRRAHFCETRNKRDNGMFHNALRKYGEDNFIWNVIATYEHEGIQKLRSMLNKAEMFYINVYDTFHFGYNLTEGGGSNAGYKHTEKTRKAMCENHANVLGEKNPFYGMKHTEKTIEENRKAQMGKKASKETRQKQSKSHLGLFTGEKNPFYRMKHTKKSNEQRSESMKLWWANKKALDNK